MNIINKCTSVICFSIIICFAGSCKSQQSFGASYLQLNKVIAMPGIKGRIDHMDINLKAGLLYVAALGNNTLEVVDINSGRVLHSINGLDEPQGVAYIPGQDEIFVANGGNGECYFFNAKTYERTGVIKLSSDADDVRYDAAERKIYVGYGDGGIAIINAATHLQTGDVKLMGHPESFQIDKKENKLYVNVPDDNMIVVIDLGTLKVMSEWKRNTLSANFPLAMDTASHLIFIGYRHPAKLQVLSAMDNEMALLDMAGDADDLYYDEKTAEIFVSGGSGYINMFRRDNSGAYKQIANIPTRNGARTSLLVPALNLFILAGRAGSGSDASVWIYKVTP